MPEKLEIDGPFDLKKTLECGQTFFWHKTEDGKYYTVRNKGVLKVWQEDEKLFYENPGGKIDPVEVLGLNNSIKKIYDEISRDEFIQEAIDRNRGLRIINDEFFHCLISFITSAQMQIPRIKEIQDQLAEKFGKELSLDETYYQFPEPEVLAEVPLEELESLGLGYRAKYIKKSSKMVVNDKINPEEIKGMNYEEAKEELMKLPGVGDKVADCVLLFSLGFLEAFPIDTWMWKVIEKKYSGLEGKNYAETSENMRDYFGRYAGYAHEYLFHYGGTCMEFG